VSAFERLRVVDSHTAGEATRVIIEGGPQFPAATMAQRRDWFREEHDYLRTTLISEPRGSAVMVGAIFCESTRTDCSAGVIFFNNVGYLGMCVHGTIGLMVTLGYLGKIRPGKHRIDTPVGIVTATLHDNAQVTVENVPSYRTAQDVRVSVPGYGAVSGDVAWGGNWFFLANETPIALALANVPDLTEYAWAIRTALESKGVTAAEGALIDHIELYGPSRLPGVHSKNFVLCPGKAYDRSPCGTGTSAKLACLYADGKLKPGGLWRQESIVGSVFEGCVRLDNGHIIPSIKGSAYITADTSVLLDPSDPFRFGISS